MNNATCSPSIEADFVLKLAKASQNNVLGTIYYLSNLWHISILNLCKYLNIQINVRFNLFIDEIDSNICLAIPNATLWSVNISIEYLDDLII